MDAARRLQTAHNQLSAAAQPLAVKEAESVTSESRSLSSPDECVAAAADARAGEAVTGYYCKAIIKGAFIRPITASEPQHPSSQVFAHWVSFYYLTVQSTTRRLL